MGTHALGSRLHVDAAVRPHHSVHWAWLAGGLLLAFAVPFVFADVLEINRDLFYGAGYRRMNERDTYAAPILQRRRNKAHTIYRQHQLDDLGPNAGVRLDSDWITVSRFDGAVEADAIAAALSGEADEWRREGVTAARVGSRTTDHPIYTTTRPHYMVLLEWQSRPSAGAMLIESLTQKLVAKGTISRQITFEGHRIYPWPND